MKKIKITTPENIEIEYTLANIGSRAAAAAIDFAVQFAITILLLIGISLIVFFAPDFWGQYYGWIIGISLIIYFLISYGYYIVMELSMNGMTIGKKLLRLRTIRNNGQSITLKYSAIRTLFRIFIDMFGIGVVSMFFSKEHKRIGDYAASTIVVIEDDKTSPITLESLEKSNEKFDYYLSTEEQDLLRDYLSRKNSMEDYSQLRNELKTYFKNKFEDLGILEEWEEFIKNL